ncbi:Ku protein [Streptomyces sp. NBRC 110611]|uniref:ERF family protein n=1 Tax=Streptomyces sp. NBRC 110611 TaxID=1621259 RepID=UPI000859136E|nr:ERF family protein [Streptomyces sp. NBRC 110611]GAU67660.1 Ku protein [Streptomyces sp. NBRC 110611]
MTLALSEQPTTPAALTPAAYSVPTPAGAAHVQYIPAPHGAPADAPRVFTVINAVMRDTVPVGKDQVNAQQRYKFRGIDDLMSAVAGPMRMHGLFILPEVAEQSAERRGEKMTTVRLTMRYYLYGPAGDALVATVPGEAADFADKATNKAMSASMKYLLLQVLMIPVDARSIDDGDRDHPAEPTEQQRAERAAQQRRRAERQQPRGQRSQQLRRSSRAEAGPWEQPPQQAPVGPPRDFLAEATAAPSPEAFATVRAAAVEAGAPADYLARLDAIAAQKRTAAQQPQRPREPQPSRPDQERAALLGEMYDAARAAGLVDNAEADETFANRYGLQPGEASSDQLREMRDDLLDHARAAGGAQ